MPIWILLAGLFFAVGTPAAAHVTLEVEEAPIGSYYKAVLKVPHGCEGAETTALIIDIPDGVLAVKPMPKAGWQIETKKGAYARTYPLHGKDVADGVKEVTWKGGALPDEEYDEFVFAAYLANELSAGTTLYFPVTQVCGSKSQGWTEVPKDNPAGEMEWPAPGLMLTPARKN
jgi:uncharacterized protein YcnI